MATLEASHARRAPVQVKGQNAGVTNAHSTHGSTIFFFFVRARV